MANLNRQNDEGNRRLKDVKVLTATISHDMFPSTTSGEDSVVPFAVPKNSIVLAVNMRVKTAFTGTTPEIIVGTSADDNAFITTTNFTPTAGYKVGSGTGIGLDTADSDLAVLAEMTWGASKPGAGEAVLVVQYVTYGPAKTAGAPYQSLVDEVEVS